MEYDHLFLGVLIAVQGVGIMVTLLQVIHAVRDLGRMTDKALTLAEETLRAVRSS